MAKYAKGSPRRSTGPSIAKPPTANPKLRDFLAAPPAAKDDGPRPKVAKLPGQGKLLDFLSEPPK